MSRSHWMLAVLEDLRSYAANNGLADLVQALEQASHAAMRDLPGADLRADARPSHFDDGG